MTKQEYTDFIKEMVKNPDTATASAQTLIDNIGTDLDTLEAFRASDAEKDKRIRDLQDTNIKLFLGQTGKPPEDKEDKPVTLRDFAAAMVDKEKKEI